MISRQAAIEAIEKARANVGHNMERAVGAAFIEILDDVGEDIGRLPPAQFATDTNVGAKLSTNLAQLGTDCISRQAAIKTVGWYSCHSGDELLFADNALRQLPPIQPKKEIAKRVLWTGWKGCRDTRYKCPNCKKPVKNDDIYCHRCGQKLMFPHISFTDYVPGEKQETIVRWDDE